MLAHREGYLALQFIDQNILSEDPSDVIPGLQLKGNQAV